MSDWQPRPAEDRLDKRRTLLIGGASMAVFLACCAVAWYVAWPSEESAVPPVATAQQALDQAAAERAAARAQRQRAAWVDQSAGLAHVPFDLTMDWFQAEAAAAAPNDADEGGGGER